VVTIIAKLYSYADELGGAALPLHVCGLARSPDLVTTGDNSMDESEEEIKPKKAKKARVSRTSSPKRRGKVKEETPPPKRRRTLENTVLSPRQLDSLSENEDGGEVITIMLVYAQDNLNCNSAQLIHCCGSLVTLTP
jgi:hypothetical protein